MAIPTIFQHNEQTARLAAYFEDLYDYLLAQGVPETRLPSPWHILSHVVDCLDEERIGQWLEAYVGIEGTSNVTTENRAAPAPSAPRRVPRPAYLRALAESTPPSDPEPNS
jgi:hypothetical protein